MSTSELFSQLVQCSKCAYPIDINSKCEFQGLLTISNEIKDKLEKGLVVASVTGEKCNFFKKKRRYRHN